MSKNLTTLITGLSLCAGLTLPVVSSAQEHNTKQPHYIVKDMGTFGGPNSFFFSSPVVESVNNRGTVVGGADTGLPDPYAPNCFSPDCYILHAFKWKNGVLTDLGTLPSGYSSTAYGVNEKGLIMGESENGFIDPITGLPEQVAVRWEKDGEIVDLGTLGGSFSFANAMNNRGQVIGLALNTVPDPYSFLGLGTETHGFVWRNGFMEDLGTLGGPDSWAAAINEGGQVVGWSYVNSTPNANNGDTCAPNVPTQDPFLWQDGRMIDLGTFGGTCGYVGSAAAPGGGAINSRGQVIGTSNLAGNQSHHAFLWNEGALTDLGTLGGNNAEAYWINGAGDIVGRADVRGPKQNHHGFLWKNGVMTDLGVPHGQPCSTAIDINAKGQIILSTGICGVGGGPGSLWQDGVLYDLNTLIPPDSGFFIEDVNFINDSGEIAVTGILPNGDQHDLLLIPASGNDDNAGRTASTEVVAATITPLRRAASRFGRFGRSTSPLE
jgi:probable HAF family extracellular repeat protein